MVLVSHWCSSEDLVAIYQSSTVSFAGWQQPIRLLPSITVVRGALLNQTCRIALLARVDTIGNDLRRVERSQIRGFEEVRAGQDELRASHEQLRAEVRAGHEYLTARLDAVEDDLTQVVEMGVKRREAIDMLLEGQQAHTEAITSLQKGQQEVMAGLQQVIEMLMGKPRRND